MNGSALRDLWESRGLSMADVLAGYPDKRLKKPQLSAIVNGIVEPPESLVRHVCRLAGQVGDGAGTNGNRPVITASIATETRFESYVTTSKAVRRKEILGVWHGTMTAREVKEALGYSDMNAVRPRISELAKAGRLEEVEKRVDPVTGKKVTAWKLKER